MITSSLLTSKERFQLMAIIHVNALPALWRHHLKTCNNFSKNSIFSSNAQLHLNGQNVNLDNVTSKSIYNEIHSKNDSGKRYIKFPLKYV